MNKTTTINLSGQLFTIDDDAYQLLKAYLDKLRGQLKGDDDRDEIMQDFEQAIAEHFGELMTTKKRVVTLAMVKKVTQVIGDYEPTAESADTLDGEGTTPGWYGPFRRRPYLNKDDAIIAGVCGGIARALGVDSFWIRVLFVILLFATSGFMIVVYIILSFIMIDPESKPTGFMPDGKPLNAAALVAHSKRRFQDAKTSLKSVSTKRRLEAPANLIKRLLRILGVAVSIVAITLVTIGYAILVATWQSHVTSTNQPLSATPGGVNLALIMGSYLIIVLPLLALGIISAVRHLASNKVFTRIGLLLLAGWLATLVVFVSAVAVAVPDWADWSKQHPKNPYFQLEIVMNGGAEALAAATGLDPNSKAGKVANSVVAAFQAGSVEKYRYEVQVSADVAGIKLDPAKNQPLMILAPGQIGGTKTFNL